MKKKYNSVELKDTIAQLRKRGQAIVATAKSEVRDLTDEEETEIEDLKSQIEEKKAELDELTVRLETLSFDDETVDENEETKSDDEENQDEVPTEEPTESGENSDEEESQEDDEEEPKLEINKRHMKRTKFSLLKAVNGVVNGNMDAVTRSVVAAGKEEARKAGINTEGQIQIPVYEKRDAVTVTKEGEDVVQVDIYDILKPLYAKNVLVEAGAKVYDGLRGDVQIPVMGKGNVAWAGEVAAATEAGYEFNHVTLHPKRLTAYVDISNQMLAQDSVGVENAIKEDIVNAINAKLEETLLGDGAATATQPAGILNKVTPATITDYQSILDNEAVVDDANVGDDRVYILSNKMKAALRGMAKGSKSTQLVMESGEVDGTKAYATSLIDGKKYIYGDFSNFAIGIWGNIDIKVDPYTQAVNGCTRLVVNFYVDAQVLRDGVFAAGTIA